MAPFPGVSRRHATLRPLDGGILVTDLGSKNGLIKDGTRLEEILLRPRDRIRLGRAWLELEEIDSSEAALGLSMENGRAEPDRSSSSDTGQLTDLPDGGSPAAALRLVRAVESAGGIDPTAPDATRALLEMARAALNAGAVWVWARANDGPPYILAIAGQLPSEQTLDSIASLAVAAADSSAPTAIAAVPGCLASALPGHSTGLVATLLDQTSKVTPWKIDLFEHLTCRLSRAASPIEGRPAASAMGSSPLKFPEEFVRGESVAMAKLIENLVTAAHSRLDVLLLGETGTGKELIARTVHLSGPTQVGPFLAINCAAIPADLLEAQLFGVEARVATGVDPRPGLFLKADGGSLFLDEIGDLPEPLQAKLLRAIQEREILPLGATKPRKIAVRVISASNKNLGDLARQGRFRADLYYRLRGLQFHMPPLRERREDLPALVLAFAQRAAREYEKSIQGVSRKALTLLTAYDWPGNIRELKNEVERAVLLCPDGAALESTHFAPIAWVVEQSRLAAAASQLPAALEAPTRLRAASSQTARSPSAQPATDLRSRLNEVERAAILESLSAARGNKSRAAKALGVTRNGLALKMKRLALEGQE